MQGACSNDPNVLHVTLGLVIHSVLPSFAIFSCTNHLNHLQTDTTFHVKNLSRYCISVEPKSHACNVQSYTGQYLMIACTNAGNANRALTHKVHNPYSPMYELACLYTLLLPAMDSLNTCQMQVLYTSAHIHSDTDTHTQIDRAQCFLQDIPESQLKRVQARSNCMPCMPQYITYNLSAAGKNKKFSSRPRQKERGARQIIKGGQKRACPAYAMPSRMPASDDDDEDVVRKEAKLGSVCYVVRMQQQQAELAHAGRQLPPLQPKRRELIHKNEEKLLRRDHAVTNHLLTPPGLIYCSVVHLP